MLTPRRIGASLGAAFLLVLAGCVDSTVVSPEVDGTPSFAISDGSTGQGDDFYFLPPLADGNPNPVGEFNPYLRPTMRVCEITADELGLNPPGGKPTCTDQGHREILPAGALTTSVDGGNKQYAISWDTDGPETARNINTNKFLLLEVLVGEEVMGWIDLDPQNPQGPGQSTFDAYAFRVGETIPVKFFLSTDVLCTPSAFVTECITGVAVNQDGANLSLENEGNKLGLIIFQNSLPSPFDEIVVTVERIDPVVFESVTGEECIPGGFGLGDESMFDAPQFGDCFRVTTVPEVTTPLSTPALVSICLDPTSLAGIDLTQDQQDQLTMVRYDDIDIEWEALADAAGDCPTTTASLLDVPESGFMRYAALGINAVADFIGPEPVAARDIRLGALTGSFSRFRYALPGQLIKTAGDGTVIQASDDNDVVATVNVVDHEGVAVENAIVHFATSDGAVSASEVVSGADGNATVTWTVDRATEGNKTLTASALGLLAGPVPEHSTNYSFTAESVTFTAAIVGVPSALAQDPAGPIDDAVAGQPETLSVTATDAGGNLVEGATVTWTCTPTCEFNSDPSTTQPDGSATIETLTGPDGVATVAWTAFTSGSQVSVASAGAAPDATFNATVAPGDAANLNATQSSTTGLIGGNIDLGVAVTDAFGNPRSGDAVTWSITGGGGSFASSDGTAAPDGSASASWTLGLVPGTNTASVSVGGLTETFTVIADCFQGWGVAGIDGAFDAGTEWKCAEMRSFDANLSGGSTPAEVYWMNDGTNLYMAVRILQSSLAKVNDVRIDFDNDGDNVTEVGDDAIGYNGEDMVFIDEYLDQRCLNRSQSGCGRDDSSVDGSGAVDNDGTWTTFELAHPLSGTPGEDFAVSAGDVLGFFLSVQQGNGAQGNTQWPAFRTYESISIVGPGS